MDAVRPPPDVVGYGPKGGPVQGKPACIRTTHWDPEPLRNGSLPSRSPLEALRAFNTDPACRATVEMAGGGTISVLGIQRHYLRLAEAQLGRPFLRALQEAPSAGRAHWRGRAVPQLSGHGNGSCDWASVCDGQGRWLNLSDPHRAIAPVGP